MSSPLFKLENIKIRHQDALILDIVDLLLPQNQCTAVLGENGAGKTSLLNLLAFISRPSEGQISLFGQTMSQSLPPALRRRIGLVSQQPYLLAGSVADNIALALRLQNIDSSQHPHAIGQALEQTNLTHLATQSAQSLSGGELKRAAIARILAYNPDILLLDEPFSHLDHHHSQLLEKIISEFAKQAGKSVIFSSHNRLQAHALADNSVNLVAGRPTTAPLLNLFHGHYKAPLFHTAHLLIHATSDLQQAHHIAIDPNEIIVSDTPLSPSSMRNSFEGRLVQIAEEAGTTRLSIDCGENFQAIISPESLSALRLSLGQTVWISFKSTAVTLL